MIPEDLDFSNCRSFQEALVVRPMALAGAVSQS